MSDIDNLVTQSLEKCSTKRSKKTTIKQDVNKENVKSNQTKGIKISCNSPIKTRQKTRNERHRAVNENSNNQIATGATRGIKIRYRSPIKTRQKTINERYRVLWVRLRDIWFVIWFFFFFILKNAIWLVIDYVISIAFGFENVVDAIQFFFIFQKNAMLKIFF